MTVAEIFMDNLSGNSNSSSSSTKASTLKSLRGSISPMQFDAQNFTVQGHYPHPHHHSQFHVFDPYASSDSRSGSPSPNSPFIRYLSRSSGSSGSGSRGGWVSGSSSSGSGGGYLPPMTLTSIENFEMLSSRSPGVFKTPVKVEEDVLVIDGILVNTEKSRRSKGSAGQRTRSPSSLGLRLSSSSSSSTSSGKENHSFNKTERCRSWEDFGTCRFGSKCQLAHVKEDQQVKNHISDYKSEELLCKLVRSGSCADVKKSCLDLHKAKASTSLIGRSSVASVESVEVGSVSSVEPESTANNGYSNAAISSTKDDWCPLDDGIEVSLPSATSDHTPSREAINAYTQSILYGPSARRRLPVFTELCLK